MRIKHLYSFEILSHLMTSDDQADASLKREGVIAITCALGCSDTNLCGGP